MTDDKQFHDPEILFRETREQFDKIAELQRSMTELQGFAESQDGRVKVIFTQNEGISDIQLDPRVTRMPSAELGDLIKTVARAAKRDLERQAQELLEGLGTEGDLRPGDLGEMFNDPQRLSQTLGGVSEAFSGAAKGIESMLEQVRRAMGTGPGPGSR